jgi:hypothetical protein
METPTGAVFEPDLERGISGQTIRTTAALDERSAIGKRGWCGAESVLGPPSGSVGGVFGRDVPCSGISRIRILR